MTKYLTTTGSKNNYKEGSNMDSEMKLRRYNVCLFNHYISETHVLVDAYSEAEAENKAREQNDCLIDSDIGLFVQQLNHDRVTVEDISIEEPK